MFSVPFRDAIVFGDGRRLEGLRKALLLTMPRLLLQMSQKVS